MRKRVGQREEEWKKGERGEGKCNKKAEVMRFYNIVYVNIAR